MTGTPERGVPVRVLLVEDSENDAMLLLRELRRGGYEPIHERVYTPEDMERALRGAEARGEPHEVVISDYYMPRFRAPDALALLRRLGYDVPFIVVSGKIGEDAAVGVMKAGADDYLTKENMARLCPAIRRELKEAGVRRERTRAEEALARSEIRFRRLVEQAADAMFVHDLEGRFVDVNRQACESLGYPREELLGMSVADVEVGHDPGSLKGLWDEISSGVPLTLEGTHRRRDGTVFPIEVRVGMFEDGGSPLVLALARDITGRKEAEKRVRETDVRYRTLVEQLPAVTYVQEPFGDKRVTYVSPQTESVLGYPADREMLDPDHWLNIMHPDDRERVFEEDRRTDDTGEPFRAEYRQFASDGRMVWVRDEATLVLDEEGRPLYWQGIQYDVTEEKLVEEELRRSEERYRTFIDQSTEGIWRFELGVPMPTDLPEDEQIDHFYRHAYLAECNDAMARIYGFGSASDLVGARVGDLLPRSEPGNVEYLRAAARAGYRLKDGETRELDRDGNERVILNNLGGIVEDGLLVRIWGTQRDVTEQKEAEDQLARLASFPELDPNPIVETSVDGVPTYLNPAAQARFPDLEELGPRHPALADLEEVNSRIWSAGGRPFVREVRVGGGFYQQVVSRTPEGGLLRIYVTDVTERRRAEDALRASEERFRSLVQNASDIILVLAGDGTILYESPAVERILGFAPEDRIGLGALGLIHPEDRDRVAKVLRDHRDVPGPFPPLEYRVRDKRGSWRYLEAVGENLLHDPAVKGIVINARDITERRLTEEALRESRESLQAILDNTTAVIYVKDEEGRFTLVNRRFEELFGLSKEEVLGRTDHDLFPEEAAEEYRRNDLEVLRSGASLEAEETVLRGEEARTYLSVKFPLKGPDGLPYALCGISTDITRRKETEERARFLAALDRTLQPITDPDEVMATTARMLGEHVGADRCAYAEVEADEDHFRITGDYTRDVPSIVGRFAMSQFGAEALRLSRENKPYVVHDAEEDGRVAGADLAAYRQTRIRAVISVPLHKGGRFVAGMAVHQKTPRRWSREEVELLVAVANRCWESIERARAARDLRQSEELYRNVVEQAAEGIFLLDVDSMRMLEANAALGATLGYAPEELKGMSFYDISAHDRESIDGNVIRVLREGRLSLGVRQYRRKDGGLVDVEISISLVSYGGRRAMCVVAHDVTGRRRAERALGEIREAERNRIARELHDSILQDIVYALQEIQILQVTGQNGGDPALGDAAGALRRSVEGLRGAIFELRLKETLDSSFVHSLEDLVDLNRRMARGAYEIEFVVGEGVPPELPEGRGRELLRIVQEALTNVRRHSGARHARVELGVEGDTLYAEVRDDGRGFDPGRSRVGVGRHSMRHRALDMGGEIELQSRPGRGTRVLCRVPLSRLTGDDPPGGQEP